MSNNLMLRKAERKQAKIRLGMFGPSGSGKTYGALLVAKGIAGDWEKIAIIDTENGSADLYSHLGGFNVISLEAPFTPERYVEAISACEKAGMEVIIVDSISHEWDGKGGCLESNDLIAQTRFKGNTWAAWSVTTPRHQKFIEAINTSKCHVITCGRSKTDTIQTEDRKVKKVGMKEITRDGFEYELTLSFSIDRDGHYTTASKDRTGIFIDKDPFVISEETGKKIKDWSESGAPIREQEKKPEVDDRKSKIMAELKRLGYNPKTKDEAEDAIFSLTMLNLAEENYDLIISALSVKMPESAPKSPVDAPKPKNEQPVAPKPKQSVAPSQAGKKASPIAATANEPVGPMKLGMLKNLAKQHLAIETDEKLAEYIRFNYDLKIKTLKELTVFETEVAIKDIMDAIPKEE